MKVKKILSDSIGISIGGVGISEANKIEPYGNVLGTTMGAGMAGQMIKKKRGFF